MPAAPAGAFSRRFVSFFLPALCTLALAACDNGSNTIAIDPPAPPPEPLGEFSATVVSSPPDAVSGGTARVGIGAPAALLDEDIVVELDGEDISERFRATSGRYRLLGRVEGLVEGENRLRVSSAGEPVTPAELTLVNHPQTGPIFSGPQQAPFLCATDDDRAKLELGLIRDEQCSVERVVSFKYRTTEGAWADWEPGQARPADMATTTTIDGETVDFIVRWERGTINRFLYSLAVLVPGGDVDGEPDLAAWNRRLIYYFQGGVAIGHYQGDPSRSRMLYDHGLGLGYAVAYSTGTKTGTTRANAGWMRLTFCWASASAACRGSRRRMGTAWPMKGR